MILKFLIVSINLLLCSLLPAQIFTVSTIKLNGPNSFGEVLKKYNSKTSGVSTIEFNIPVEDGKHTVIDIDSLTGKSYINTIFKINLLTDLKINFINKYNGGPIIFTCSNKDFACTSLFELNYYNDNIHLELENLNLQKIESKNIRHLLISNVSERENTNLIFNNLMVANNCVNNSIFKINSGVGVKFNNLDVIYSPLVFTGTSVFLKNSSIEGNKANLFAGGITMIGAGKLYFEDSLIQHNTSGISGGGVYIGKDFKLEVFKNSQIFGNTARTGTGGGIYFENPSPEIDFQGEIGIADNFPNDVGRAEKKEKYI